MINLGIIGPGLIWENSHRQFIDELHRKFRVTAVSARSERNRERGAEAYPEAQLYSDYTRLIADPNVDAVVILTPIELNAPVAIEVLDAGKHAIVEKPMAVSAPEAANVISHWKESGKVLYILEQHVHKSVLATVQNLIRSGEIGDLLSYERAVHVRIDSGDADTTGGYGNTQWRIEPQFPLGNFFDGGIHELALLQELVGAPTEVYARKRNIRPDFGDADLLMMNFNYQDGTMGVFAHSAVLGAQGNWFALRGSNAGLIVSDKKIIHRRNDGTERIVPVHWEDERRTMWHEIASVLENGKSGAYTPQKALTDIRTLEAVAESAESNAPVRI